jgi:L-ribulose-5-phosphate 3-epimerase
MGVIVLLPPVWNYPEDQSMKKSIMRATLPQSSSTPLLKLLEPLRKAGFQGIQLGISDLPSELSLRTGDADVAKLARACRDAGLEPHSLVSTPRFFREEDAERRRAVDEAGRAIEIAAGLGARTILIHPGQLSPAVPYEDCWKFALESLNALKARAASVHVRLGLENVWNRFLMSPLEFVRLLDEIDSPAVGIWFDIGNVVAVGFPEQWVRILGGKRLVGIHLKDFRRGPGDHFGTYDGFVPLFHGSVNWPVVMRQLSGAGFDDYLVTEVSLGHMPLTDALREISGQLDVLLSLARAKD